MADPAFVARPAFSALGAASGTGGGVIVTARDGLGLASVIVRKGQRTALTQRVRQRFDIDLPHGPHRVAAGDIAFAGTGPETWLAMQENGGNDFALYLQQDIGATAAISDQRDAYAVLRMTGLAVRDTLAKLVPIDVHPRAFRPGHLASTVASHIGVTLWRLEDAPDGTPVFEIAVPRSLAESFWHALSQSAAEFGFIVA